jgi:RNA polymerase sigma-70 factor (ECF subfamily)
MQLATGAQPISSVPNPSPFPLTGPDALERVFDAHHVMVFRAAYRVTGNAADAEDVLQTVFLRLAGRDLGTEVVENMEGYLRRAAINASLNLLERRASQNLPLESAPEPQERVDQSRQRDIREVLRLAMATLGGRTAEMFALRFIEGHSNGEIADMFNVSALVVGVTLHRARKQLQKEIQALGGLK